MYTCSELTTIIYYDNIYFAINECIAFTTHSHAHGSNFVPLCANTRLDSKIFLVASMSHDNIKTKRKIRIPISAIVFLDLGTNVSAEYDLLL